MSDDYTTKPVSEVKTGDIIYWASVRADVEVVAAGPPGFYGYTFDVRYKGEIEQARYKVGETVRVKRLERKSEKEWWEKSPEEFASGFTEEVHVHHTGSEQEPVTSNKEKQFEALYGPCAKGEYSVGATIAYRSPDTGGRVTGVVVWIVGPGDVARKHQPLSYIVESNDRGGFPDVVKQIDILQ